LPMNWGLDIRSPSANYSRPKRIFRLQSFGSLSIDETVIVNIALYYVG